MMVRRDSDVIDHSRAGLGRIFHDPVHGGGRREFKHRAWLHRWRGVKRQECTWKRYKKGDDGRIMDRNLSPGFNPSSQDTNSQQNSPSSKPLLSHIHHPQNQKPPS